MAHGYEGLGLFYTILERLAFQEQPIKTDVLKTQLKIGKKLGKQLKFMESLGILSSNNGETFNEKLLKNSQNYIIKKEKTKKRVAKFRENQENVTRTELLRNTPKALPKISKDKISKDKIYRSSKMTISDFNLFWTAYPRKVQKQKAEEKFMKLEHALLNKIMEALEIQKKTKKWIDGYISYPTTWINGALWEDEVEEMNIEDEARQLSKKYGAEVAFDKINTKYGLDAAMEIKKYL